MTSPGNHLKSRLSAFLIRAAFGLGGRLANRALRRYVPPGVTTQFNVHFDPSDADAYLDLHRPRRLGRQALPLIVWIHGGGYVGGSRSDVANYGRILAADGYVVATVDYSLAPAARYPRAIQQLSRALSFLTQNAVQLQIDSTRIVLAGDSAGAQLAAQLSLLASSPVYATQINLTSGIAHHQLLGAVLFCGPQDARLMATTTPSSWFTQTVMHAYFGSADPPPYLLQEFAVVPNVTSAFPRAFISAGDADPLAPQSYALAHALIARGVAVETAFFHGPCRPRLRHEYQFDLSLPESKVVLRRLKTFLHNVLAPAVS